MAVSPLETPKKGGDLLATVEQILDAFDGSSRERGYQAGSVGRDHLFDLSYFRRVRPLALGPGNHDEPSIFSDVRPRDVDGHWDMSMMSFGDHAEDRKYDPQEKPHYTLHRFRRAALHEVRGQRVFSNTLSEHAVGTVDPVSGEYTSARFWCWYVNDEWMSEQRVVMPGRDNDGQRYTEVRNTGLLVTDERGGNMAWVALGLTFNSDYEWYVDLRREAGLELSFVTDPIGAQAIFRLRDMPEGAARRAALRNWVMEHWRRTRACETKVRQHLRGAVEFDWYGLHCTIRPSPDDLRLNEKYRMEREAERRAGRDRR